MRRLKTIFRLVKLSIRIAAALGCVLLSILTVRSYYVAQDLGGRITFAKNKNPNAVDATTITLERGYFSGAIAFGLREVLPVSAIPRVTREERALVKLGPQQWYCTSRTDLQDPQNLIDISATGHFHGVYWGGNFGDPPSPKHNWEDDGIWVSEGEYDLFLAFPMWLLLIPCVLIAQPWKLISVVRKKRRRSKNHCPACGYDTRANPGRCSECGTVIS